VSGVVWPAAIVTVEGETDTMAGLALDNVTTTPPCGAGEPRATERLVCCPRVNDRFDGTVMEPKTCTAMKTVAAVTFGELQLAVIVAVPAATPVIGTVTLVAFASIVTVAGTVALAVLLELRVIVRPPAGAGAERSNVVLNTPPALTAVAWVEKLSDAPTLTVCESPVNPVAEAVTVAEPNATPVTSGAVVGAVAPCGMKTVDGTVRMAVLPLAREMVTPPAGAGNANTTFSGTDWPGPTVTFAGSAMEPSFTTKMLSAPEV
jgi:hypothetical protein